MYYKPVFEATFLKGHILFYTIRVISKRYSLIPDLNKSCLIDLTYIGIYKFTVVDKYLKSLQQQGYFTVASFLKGQVS